MNVNEEMRYQVVDAYDKYRPVFDVLIDQTICTVRDAGTRDDRSIAIAECAVTFADLDIWNDRFQSFTPGSLQVPVEELHRIFLAYLMSVCLHRLVWP